METFTEDEYYDRWASSLVRDEVFIDRRGGFDCVACSTTAWSDNYYRSIEFRPGLSLDICDELYHQDLGVIGEHERLLKLVSKFYLLGYQRTISPNGIAGVAPDYIERGGYHYLFYLPNIEETEQNLAGNHTQRVRIKVDLDLLRTFATDIDSIPQLLHPLLESDAAPMFHSSTGQISYQMQQLIEQILHTPYQGMVGRMYLESRALELIALQLTQLLETEQCQLNISPFKRTEIDRVHQAKDILLQQQIDPPSLMELSQQVGLYHMKLKRGFQEVFGTTPFGYLRAYRMELARRLLRDRALSVSTVAERVGYASQGRFASAFKRKFGITPSECRAGKLPTAD